MINGYTEEQMNSGKYFFAQYKTESFNKEVYESSYECDKVAFVKLLHRMSPKMHDYVFNTIGNEVRLFIDVGMLIGDINYISPRQGKFLLNVKWMNLETKKYNSIIVKFTQREYLLFISMFNLTYMGL